MDLGRLWRTRGPLVTASRFISERYFGNSAGLRNNLHGRKYLAHVGKTEIARRLSAEGLAPVPFKIDVSGFYARYLDVIEDSGTRGSGGYSRMLDDPEAIGASSVLTPEIRSLIEDIYGGPFEITVISAYRTTHVPEAKRVREIFSDRWHFDWRSTAQLRLFITLSDVTDKDGPLMLNSIENTKRHIATRAWRNRRSYEPSVDDSAFRFTGSQGSALFCKTTLCLHRAGIPEEGRTRDMLSFSFMPAPYNPPSQRRNRQGC